MAFCNPSLRQKNIRTFFALWSLELGLQCLLIIISLFFLWVRSIASLGHVLCKLLFCIESCACVGLAVFFPSGLHAYFQKKISCKELAKQFFKRYLKTPWNPLGFIDNYNSHTSKHASNMCFFPPNDSGSLPFVSEPKCNVMAVEGWFNYILVPQTLVFAPRDIHAKDTILTFAFFILNFYP